MKIKGATTVLNKERIFLGLTMKELLVFIERNPYAALEGLVSRYKVYKKQSQ